ncbi:MAG: ABC-2 family transporter protein [Chlamydiales bacterium]|nr:ABC-2 family transporter protein [Chlamydiales bacterium]
MKMYLAILKCRMATLFQYRMAAFAGLCTQIFWGLVKTMILTAFYQNASGNEPLSKQEAIAFIWISQALLQLLPWNFDKDAEEQIRSGNVAYELLRPLDLYLLWYTKSVAIRVAPTLLRALPVFIIASLFFDLLPPVSLFAFFVFLFSLILSLILAAAITTLVLLSLFWTFSGDGVQRILLNVSFFFSGMLVPLPLFPNWMQPVLSLQPFRCLIDIPSRIYTGVISLEEAPLYLLLQIAWGLICILYGQFLTRRALKKFVIHGG